jgi:RNA polymerase sigma-70 factor, ECF subfamily
MMETTDSDLMCRVREGDHEAFGTLVDRHKDGLVNYLTHLWGERDRAEEFAQEAFLRLYVHARRYDERERLAPYLYRIATNLVRSEFRRLRRWRLLVPMMLPEQFDPHMPAHSLLQNEAGEQVRRALDELPIAFRAPLVLYEIEGWSYREIASSLGCREGTVKSRIARGRERLRALLAPYWNGGPDEKRERRAAPALAAKGKSF